MHSLPPDLVSARSEYVSDQTGQIAELLDVQPGQVLVALVEGVPVDVFQAVRDVVRSLLEPSSPNGDRL